MRGVDGLDGADEVDLGAEGGEEFGLFEGGFGEGEGGEAEEVVEFLTRDFCFGSGLG